MRKVILFAAVYLLISTFLSKPVLAGPKAAYATAGVEYTLPYPGILPDSPLYIFKVVRDKLVGTFILDSKQKAFYSLFLSDKRLAAGQALVKKGKGDIGAVTIIKAQDYYRQAVNETLKSKNNDLLSKLAVAGAKHEDVITELLVKADNGVAEKLDKALIDGQKDKNRVMEVILLK